MADHRYRVVTLMEPQICINCRFAVEANVRMADGHEFLMLHCRRKDCDNWVPIKSPPCQPVSVQDEKQR